MKWIVRLSHNAVRARRRMSEQDRRRIDAALLAIESDPLVGDVVPLRGPHRGSFRRRVGDWRIVLTLHPEERPQAVDINDILRRTSTTY
ncbi:MAG: hypothetical protein WA417_22360 [Stellaceae bacterium]|jgi:mRNA-degrading endonuclease RelE of RelBE toxin-antitoxin system